MIETATRPLLEVKDLCVDYLTDRDPVRAVDRVSLELAKGEFLGIVGESGCGKSTLLFAIARLLSQPAEISSGEVWFGGRDMVSMDEDELRHLRWRDYSVVMPSAMNALNPVITIAEQLADAVGAHQRMSSNQLKARSEELMRLVGIDPEHLRSYPHQLSGGEGARAENPRGPAPPPGLALMEQPDSGP